MPVFFVTPFLFFLTLLLCFNLPVAFAADNASVTKTDDTRISVKGARVTVTVHSATLRIEPSQDSRAVTWASKGTVLTVIDEFSEPSGKVWYKVRTSSGKRLWVSDKAVILSWPEKAEVHDVPQKKEALTAVKTAPENVANDKPQKDKTADSKQIETAAIENKDKKVSEPVLDEKSFQTLLEKGDVFFREGKCREFIDIYGEAIRIAEGQKNITAVGKLHYNIAECYSRLKQYDQAIKHLDTAIAVGKITDNAELEVLSLIDISRVSILAGDRKKASEFLNTAAEKAKSEIFLNLAVEDNLKALVSFHMAAVLFELGDKNKAREKLDYSLTVNSDFKLEEDIIGLLKSVDVTVHEKLVNVSKILDEAWSLYEKGDYKGMEKLSLDILKTAKSLNYKRAVFGANYYLSMCNLSMGNYKNAVNYSLQSQEMAERGNDRMRLGMVYNLTGNIFKQNKDFDKALFYYLKNLEIVRNMNNREGESVTLNNIGNILMDKGEQKEALKYYTEALRISSDIGKDRHLIAQNYLSVGRAYKKNGDYDDAEKHILNAINIFRELGNTGGELVCIWELAGNYSLRGQHKTAIKMLEDNLKRADKFGMKQVFIDDIIIFAGKDKDYLKLEKYNIDKKGTPASAN